MSDNDVLNKYEVKEERDEFLPHFSNHTDNYLQFAPIAAVYGLNLAGVKGRNDFTNRTILLLKSELLVSVLTYSLKQITAVPRPDSGKPTSMPSGHTAQAFAAATFMAKEYGQRSIWYSIGAYAVATGVGAMRVLNNRHWVSDVLVGAGVGILSTNVAYLTHQYKWGKRPKSAGSTLVLPSFDGQSYALAVVHQFR
ncbi:MAG: phosphatase PAP2 family protein [Chryseolinea sp.]